MSEPKPQEPDQTPASGIPAPLLEKLHDANEQFHHAREHVDHANAALVNPFEERQRAADDVREAERAVEEAEAEIGKTLREKR